MQSYHLFDTCMGTRIYLVFNKQSDCCIITGIIKTVYSRIIIALLF